MLNELLALIETEFQRARRQASEATDSMEKHSRAGEAMAYADAKMLIAELKQKHYSDCALNNAPAYPIARCDCGGSNARVNSAAEGSPATERSES